MLVMAVFESVIAAIVVALVYDWLGVTGSAARFTSFDYRYWPMSKIRQGSVLLLIVTGAFFAATINPDHPSVIPLVILAAAMAFHGYIAVQDMFAQRRGAISNPSVTSDGDGG